MSQDRWVALILVVVGLGGIWIALSTRAAGDRPATNVLNPFSVLLNFLPLPVFRVVFAVLGVAVAAFGVVAFAHG
jgi:hypothetical protein